MFLITSKDIWKPTKIITQWLKEDKIKYKNHIIPGIENAGTAIKKLFSGENEGKLIIKVSEES